MLDNQLREKEYSTGIEDGPTMGIWKRLLGIITSPSETFSDIDRETKIGKAIVVILGLTVLFTLISLPSTLDYMKNNMLPGLPEGAGTAASGLIAGSAIAGVVIVLPITWLVVSVVYKLAFMIFGEDGDFKRIFAVNLYAQVPIVLGALIKSIISLIQPSANLKLIQTSLAVVLPKSQFGTPLYSFLSVFDIFSIWTYILVAIGFTVVFGFSKVKSYVIVGSVFVIKIIFTVVPTIFLSKLLPGGMVPGGANVNIK